AQSGQIYGAPVVASLAGTVQVVKYGSTGYGYYVIIDHGGNYKTLYGHLSGITVTAGQPVTQGQTIGYVGSTGNSTGPHLHFEIRVAGEKVDPLPYVRG
ncbi:MAG: M23 family metallopeptidase, partial [Pygmaiobacter sp.]